MKINRIYDYKPIERVNVNGARHYMVNGIPLPSVTTILSTTKDNKAIEDWKNRVGEAEAERIKNEASFLGDEMHKNLEALILGQPQSGSYMGRTLASVIAKKGLSRVDEIWGTEVSLYCDELYAGTTDLVGIFDGQPAIMDFKNTIRPKEREWIEDYFMQLAAYAIAHNERYGTKISRGVVMMATREARYQEFIIEGDEFLHYETRWAEKLNSYYNR